MVPDLSSHLRRLLFVLAALCLAAGAATAGPWPRAKGDVFLSFSQEVTGDSGSTDAGWTTLYAEYGLTPRWTIGLDLGSGADKETAMIFLQRAIGKQEGPGRLAFSSGIGVETGEAPQAFGMMGAAWGRSLGTPLGPGWVAVEPQLRMGLGLTGEWPPQLVLDTDGTLLTTASAKLDITLGATARPGLIVMAQLQMERELEGETTARLGASAVRALGKRVKVQLGLSSPVRGEGDARVKLGTWLEF